MKNNELDVNELISSSLVEKLIDKNTYATKNYYKTKIAKTQIIVANSLRFENNHIIRLKHKEFGRSKEYPTFSIKRDGKIIRHFNDAHHSDFMKIKEVDIKSISVVLENMGWLRKIEDVYYSWMNEECDEDLVGIKKWMGYTYWEKYTEKQIDSLVGLCNYLCEKHNILKSVIDFHHYHKDIKKYKGIVLKSNHIENSTDSNPLLPLKEIRERLSD
jgi:hypothetical protein